MDDRKIILNKEILHLKLTITPEQGGPRCNGNLGELSIMRCIKSGNHPFSFHLSPIMGEKQCKLAFLTLGRQPI